MICFFQRGGVDFKENKNLFRGSMDTNFSGTKGEKMILCFFFLRCMMKNSKKFYRANFLFHNTISVVNIISQFEQLPCDRIK